jgi:hypothetical protein
MTPSFRYSSEHTGTDLDQRSRSRERSDRGPHLIELRIESVPQIFHSLDPSPFRERELDKKAEESSSVGRGSSQHTRRSRVHLPEDQLATPGARDIGPAITKSFAYRAELTSLELKDPFRVGRRALLIGATVLIVSITASQAIAANLESRPIARVVAESLVIFAWVANWRPIEIFLYEWWPIARQRNLYRRLGAAEVELRPTVSSPSGASNPK